MQMKIGRWEGLYPRIQSTAKHIRCGFVCGYRKIAGPFRSERSAIIGAADREHTVLTQASTGPRRRGESNEMEHIVASGACLIIVSPQAWQARAHDFPFPSSAELVHF